MSASGKATVKIRLGPCVVYEVEVWVGSFEARSMIILGTDFMVKAGLRIDLLSQECALPEEEPVGMLAREQLADAQRPELWRRW
jgi:hypothetical protein